MVPTRAGATAVGDGLHDLLEPRRDGHVDIHLLTSGVRAGLRQSDCVGLVISGTSQFFEPCPG